MTTQKLELTWVGKNHKIRLEPRILIEDTEKSYGDPETGNMLIHWDNLLALKALEQDYAGKVKCIYIDPPYNTGNAFKHYEDWLEHSEWLNLIKPRLEILRRLLSDNGSIWISIDDTEQAFLTVLCAEIFWRDNFVACLPTIMNLKWNQDQFGFAWTHEYTVVYAKNKWKLQLNNFKISEDDIADEWSEDGMWLYKVWAPMRATWTEWHREDRPFMFYPILIKDNNVSTIPEEEFGKIYNKNSKTFDDVFVNSLSEKYISLGYSFILPMVDDSNFGRWRWWYNNENISRLNYDVVVKETKNWYSLYKKQRPEIGELPSKKPKSIFYKPEYSSWNGTSQVKAIFWFKAFDYPKPEELIRDIIELSSNEGDIILDSFLWSGTTSAVAQKLNRQYIGIEMGNHAYSLCKVRLDKVIDWSDKWWISKSIDWNWWGWYKFYELGPSVMTKDERGRYVINPNMNGELLIRALCKIENFKYLPKGDSDIIKHWYSTERDFLHVTTRLIDQEAIDRIQSKYLKEDEGILILAKTVADGLQLPPNIQVKKIPNEILRKCEYAKDDYSLPILTQTQEELEGLKKDIIQIDNQD